ncbi:unnamed protein product [Lymnaea stagnalis]|uniref:Uncharacterized protein n=1 Tax=Lymnaea stagnalis TaxID=6523 RepID=A0AAV2I496_LYMST
MMMKPKVCLCVLLISICCVRVCSSLDGSIPSYREAQIRLKEKVLSHRAIRARLSPRDDGHLNVSIIFYPIQIVRIDEVEQSMSSINYLELAWLDEDLAWNRSRYDDISLIALDYDELWHPNLFVKNSVSKYDVTAQDGGYRLLLSDTGHVTLKIGIFLKTLCDLDFTYFPFDLQTCDIDFVSGKDDCKVQLNTINTRYPPEPVVVKGEWTIVDRNLESGGLDNLGDIVYYARAKVRLKRNSLFYVTFIIVPMAASSLMTSLVFRVPPACGQKVSFLVTIFVSNAVFLGFIAATVPRSVSVMPRVMLFQIFVLLQSFLALVASLFVIRRHEQEVLSASHNKNSGGRKAREKLAADIFTSGNRIFPDNAVASKRNDAREPVEGSNQKSGSENFKIELIVKEKENTIQEKPKFDQKIRPEIRPMKCLRHVSAERLDLIFFWLFNVVSLPFYIELLLQLN